MKRIVIVALALACVWSCNSETKGKSVVVKADSVQPSALPFPPLSEEETQRYHNTVEQVLNSTLFRTRFNGGVVIAKNGTIVYEKYVGYHDLRAKDSIKPDTPFQIASTSKTLTAAAVLQLVQEGKLSLNDTIGKYFPGFPYPTVTVKMLLNHRSGLPNYLNYMDRSPWPRTQQATNADVIKTLIEWKPIRAYQPDRHFNYCNTNYVILASIVEKISGMPFPDYMKKNIFEPLGMTNTFIRHTNDPLVTQSYQPNGAPWTLDFSDGPYGDKNVYSTPRDLLKWDQALYQGRILNQQMLDSAFTPYSNERPGVHNYGLGWRLLMLPRDKKVIYHNGHWHGFNSAFARLVDEKATIIILGNRYNPAIYTTAKRLYSIFGNYNGRNDEGEE